MKQLNDLLAKPMPDSKDGLDKVWKSVGRVIEHCFDSVRDCSEREQNLILFWLASADKSKPNDTPFSIYMEKDTKEQYIRYWQQFMMFVLRRHDNAIESGVEYTEPQHDAVNYIKTRADMDDDTLDELIMNVSKTFILHDCYAKQRSALLYFTGVLGYHVGWKRWQSPGDYTPMLAGLQWVMRIVLLECTIPMADRDIASEMRPFNPLERFKEVRDRYLVEDEACPYDWIHKLLNYGFKASINMTTRSRISWSADAKVIYIDGRPLKIKDWKRIVIYRNS